MTQVVTFEDYPYGLLCMDCDKPLPPGSEYVERIYGELWSPVCLDCGASK